MRSRPFFSTVSGKFQVGLRDIVAWKTPWKNLDSESTTGIRKTCTYKSLGLDYRKYIESDSYVNLDGRDFSLALSRSFMSLLLVYVVTLFWVTKGARREANSL